MRFASLGHLVFATITIALGILGFIYRDFAPIWQPVPKVVPERELLVFLCAGVSLACGLGLLWPGTAARAARVLLAYLLLWLLLFRMPPIIRAPASLDPWAGWAETAVVVAGAWVLYVWFATDWERRFVRFATGDGGLRCARTLYGLALILFGIDHFAFLKETASLVPAWIPWHLEWAYFTGATYVVAGVAILIGFRAPLAATLSTWQIGLFTLLVWVPIMAAGSKDAFQWSETVISVALTGGAWLVADSYRGRTGVAVGKR